MKSFAFFGVLSIVALVACAPPTPPARVAAAPTPVKYVPPQTGLNNSGLDTTLPAVLDKVVKTALEEAVASPVGIERRTFRGHGDVVGQRGNDLVVPLAIDELAQRVMVQLSGLAGRACGSHGGRSDRSKRPS